MLKLSKAKTYDGNGIAEAIIENRDSNEKRKIKVAYGNQKQVPLKHGDVLRFVLPIGTGYWAYQKCERDGYSPDVWSSDGVRFLIAIRQVTENMISDSPIVVKATVV